jgi:hypothetical protein
MKSVHAAGDNRTTSIAGYCARAPSGHDPKSFCILDADSIRARIDELVILKFGWPDAFLYAVASNLTSAFGPCLLILDGLVEILDGR